MSARIKARRIPLDDHLRVYTEEKIQQTAAKHFGNPFIIIEIELTDLSEFKEGKDKQCDVIMALPFGHILHITEVSEDIYLAVASAGDKLIHSLKRYKEQRLVQKDGGHNKTEQR